MGLRNYIKNERLQNRTDQAVENTSLGAAMEAMEYGCDNPGATLSIKLGRAPNDINQKEFFEGVCGRVEELVDAAPPAFAGRLALNHELTEEKSLTPIGLGERGWLWDVMPEGGTLVFTPTE